MTESELQIRDIFGTKVHCIGDPERELVWLRVVDVAELLPDLDIIILFKEGAIEKDEIVTRNI